MSKPVCRECVDCGAKCCKVAFFECSEAQSKFICSTRHATPVPGVGVLVHARCRMLFSDNTCCDYDLRPAVCKNWEVNGVGCNMVREAFKA